jgi:hypothetical protein
VRRDRIYRCGASAADGVSTVRVGLNEDDAVPDVDPIALSLSCLSTLPIRSHVALVDTTRPPRSSGLPTRFEV